MYSIFKLLFIIFGILLALYFILFIYVFFTNNERYDNNIQKIKEIALSSLMQFVWFIIWVIPIEIGKLFSNHSSSNQGGNVYAI